MSDTLKQTFGPTNVFVDSEAIRVGARWPQEIKRALAKASVLVAAIGPSWLKIADEHGRRRLDDTKDWVRLEIAGAIERGIPIIPVTFQDSTLPNFQALPSAIKKLCSFQQYDIREDFWEQDVRGLITRLSDLGCKSVSANVRYPQPHAFPEPLTSEELEQALDHLQGWAVVASAIPGQEPKMRTELMKCYSFKSFEQVLAFMTSAAPFISNANHHPRWENIFTSLTVWTTSWDIGFHPSRKDIELAEYLDVLYRNKA